jgi:serine protease Do
MEFFGSFTDGMVSSVDRPISSESGYEMNCNQHTTTINSGNAGGALLNEFGQVIGINSSKIASTEYEGMGFAVPTSIAKPVAEALVKHGYVPNRPKLGIEYAPVSAYQLYSMVVSIKGLPQGSLVIAGISADSSLGNTDAQVGDLIIAVNGKDMKDSSVLLDLIETGAVGDTLTLTLCRIDNRTYKTSTFDITITLVEDKGTQQEEETTTQNYNNGGYYYGGASDFEDFFNDYFFSCIIKEKNCFKHYAKAVLNILTH